MKNCKSSFNVFRKTFKLIGSCIGHIFKFLACYDCELLDDRTSLRDMYNAGHIDEGKYHQFREKCWKESYDPEEIKIPM